MMAHVHVPDGVLPPWLVVAGFIAIAPLLYLAVRRTERTVEKARALSRLAVMSAVMLVAMSIELVVTHVNLSVLSGIVLGPYPAFLAVFVVNLTLALVGHGGITVVGLNTLVVGAETTLGYFLFRGLKRLMSPGAGAAVTTIVAMIASAFLLIGIGALSNIDPLRFMEAGEFWAEKEVVPLREFGATVLVVAFIGAVVEAMAIGAAVGYLARVRPDLIAGRKT